MAVEAASNSDSEIISTELGAESLRRLKKTHELREALRLPRLAGYSLALLLAAPASNAVALELGEAAVKSRLGQPLQVEIPYRTAANERLFSECISLTRPFNPDNALPAYTNARRIRTDGNRIQIFGADAVREPLLGLNVRVDCVSAPHIVRSYMLFVDPDTGREIARTPAAAVRPAANREARQRTPARATQPATTPRPAVSARARGESGPSLRQGETYRVIRGDTLSGIAARVTDRPGTIWETVELIFAANPGAFTNGNMDLIEEGREIVIPGIGGALGSTEAALPAVDPVETRPIEAGPAVIDVPQITPVVEAETSPTLAEPALSEVLGEEPTESPFKPTATPAATGESLITPGTGVVPASGSVASTPEPAEHAASDADAETDGLLFDGWLSGLLAIAAGLVLLLLLLLRRQRKPAVVPDFVDSEPLPEPTIAEPAAFDNDTDIDLDTVETDYDIQAQTGSWMLPPAAAVPEGAPQLDGDIDENSFSLPDSQNGELLDLDLDLSASGDNSVDLDVGNPMTARDSVEIGDTSVLIEANVGTELTVDAAARSKSRTNASSDPETDDHGMTVADLDMLRQDYEAELTATQQLSEELAQAVADLEKTKALRAAGGENDSETLTQMQDFADDAQSPQGTATAGNGAPGDHIVEDNFDLDATGIVDVGFGEPTAEMPAGAKDDFEYEDDDYELIAGAEDILDEATAEFQGNPHRAEPTVEMPPSQASDDEPLVSDSQAREFLKETGDYSDWDDDAETQEKKTGSDG